MRSILYKTLHVVGSKTPEQEVAVLTDHVQRLRARLLDMLSAPYMGSPMPAIACMAACQELGHPPVRNDGRTCACGAKS